VSGNKLYLSPIIDLVNQKNVSYELTERPVFNQLVMMLKKAYKKNIQQYQSYITL
jgi:putative transposase